MSGILPLAGLRPLVARPCMVAGSRYGRPQERGGNIAPRWMTVPLAATPGDRTRLTGAPLAGVYSRTAL